MKSRTLVEAFAGTVARHPDRTALTAAGTSWSYRQLDAWAAAVAAELRARGVRPRDRVALSLPPSAAAIVSILGILRAGAAYVPLDVRNPRARNRFILADSGAKVFVGDVDSAVGDVPVISAELITALAKFPPEPEPGLEQSVVDEDDEAYVIYTSGTTGHPKGVPIHHGAVIALLTGAGTEFTFLPSDRWLLFHSLAFDVSVWEIWGAFATGAELDVLSHWAARSPGETMRHIVDRGITVLNQTPTAFGSLAAAVLESGTDLPSLRYVVFAGEKLLPAAIRPWARRFGLARPTLVNMYGITETTVHSTFHEVTAGDIAGTESVIGRPLPGFVHRIVTAGGADAGVAERGVLWLAGPQVTSGYLNRPDLADRFAELASPDGPRRLRYYRSGDVVSTRADGQLIYHGREDLQVKLRGYRVELTDIEAVVAAHDRVAETVAWVQEYGPGDQRLMCAYTTRDGKVTARELRAYLLDVLPSYMWPAAYVHREDLPRTVNGKVDRSRVAKEWEMDRRTGA